MRKISQEDLDALNNLVQAGFIEVVCIDEFGEPSYRIASRFLAQHFAIAEPRDRLAEILGAIVRRRKRPESA